MITFHWMKLCTLCATRSVSNNITSSKPAKYGLLYKSINGARYPYTFVTEPYSGKPVEEGGKYYVQGTENCVKSLVTRLQSKTPLAGRNISFDRLYTSISIVRWLYERKITAIGTMMLNRKGVPGVFKDIKQRENQSSEIYWEIDGPVCISSYVVSTSKGKKNVVMLTTTHPLLGTTKDDGKEKPALYKLYDFTKGGTDIIDQRMSSYSSKPKSRKWTMVAFSYILDTARVNASTILAMNRNQDPKQVKSFQFGFDLAEQLLKPYIECRNLNGINSLVKKKIELVLGKSLAPVNCPRNIPGPSKSEKKARCYLCILEIQGDGHKKEKDKLYTINSVCQTCQKHCCVKHVVRRCFPCMEQE